MKNKTGKYLLLLLFLFACAPGSQIRVVEINQAENIQDVSFFYALPRTIFRFCFTLEKTTRVRGPYADYAEKYLGITGGIEKDQTIWTIKGVKMEVLQDADMNEIYAVYLKGRSPELSQIFTLSKEGLIAGFPPLHYYPGFSNEKIDSMPCLQTYFKDLSVKRNFYEKKDTLYKTLFVDTAFIKVPVLKKIIQQKTTEQKAEEAANFIIKTRKRRFKLLAGQYDFVPDEKALEICVRELNKVEEEYLSLFIGKTIKEEHEFVVEYIPVSLEEYRADAVCRFSDTEGLLPKTSKLGSPVNINFKKDFNPFVDKIFEEALKEKKKGQILYRIPAQTEIKLMYGRDDLYSGRCLVSQFGRKAMLSAKVLSRDIKK